MAGVTPGKGGQSALDGSVPVFDTVAEAVAQTGANASCIFVPAAFAPDAMLEAADGGLSLVVCITEGVPALDMLRVSHVLQAEGRAARRSELPRHDHAWARPRSGSSPATSTPAGRSASCSRSGTLTYEVVQAMTDAGMGQTTSVGIGGDPIIGTSFIDVLDMFNQDPETEAIVMIGEIGGEEEEKAAAFCAREVRKPMAAFIAGRTAPPGRRMGHAGAIISGGAGTAESKRVGARGGRHSRRRLAEPHPAAAPRRRRSVARDAVTNKRKADGTAPRPPSERPKEPEAPRGVGLFRLAGWGWGFSIALAVLVAAIVLVGYLREDPAAEPGADAPTERQCAPRSTSSARPRTRWSAASRPMTDPRSARPPRRTWNGTLLAADEALTDLPEWVPGRSLNELIGSQIITLTNGAASPWSRASPPTRISKSRSRSTASGASS